jgi:outer membrane protein OmpA-like peptidoglycan-associated protein
MMLNKPLLLLISLLMVLLASGCATDPYGNPRPATETEKGLGIGSAAGAAAGALIGSLSGDAGKGALIGAIGGAILGGAVGNYMEEQRRDFEQELAAEIARGDINVTKLPDDRLRVGMTSLTTFDVDSARIKPGFYSTMDKIAGIVNKYGKTQLVIAGYTDDTGSERYNLDLSKRRAGAVEQYLMASQVAPVRMRSLGYGEANPVSTNRTAEGRTLNRRVEIIIIPVTADTLAEANTPARQAATTPGLI